MFAQSATMTGINHRRPGWSRRSAMSSRTTAKHAIPRSWGRSARAGEETMNATSVSQAARRGPGRAGARSQQAAEDQRDEQSAEHASPSSRPSR